MNFNFAPLVQTRLSLLVVDSSLLETIYFGHPYVVVSGYETWKNSKSITAKLQVFINKCLRKMLRIFWADQIMSKELWKCTK